jgi:hypothetical protein
MEVLERIDANERQDWSRTLSVHRESVAVGQMVGSAIDKFAKVRNRLASPHHVGFDEPDQAFWACLRYQLEGARRHGRQFTLTLVEFPPGDAAQFVRTCQEHIRSLDSVAVLDGQLAFVWSEADRQAAIAACRRLTREGLLQTDRVLAVRHAAFPEDGLTPTALFAAVDHGSPATDWR